MKKKQAKKLGLHRETVYMLGSTTLLEVLGGKNGTAVSQGGQALGCPSECCGTYAV